MDKNSLSSIFSYILFLVMMTTFNFAQAEEKVTFYHYDLLGSPVATTNELGEVTWREEYTPYGKKLLNQDSIRDNVRGYTGHVHDSETGLTYMQARYYDPEIGRFMGVDPVGFKSKNPISFNRYAYANNNPYKYTDPNGEYAEAPFEAASLALGVSSLANNIQSHSYLDATIDGLGVVGDLLGTAIPGVPGVIGIGIATSRAGMKASSKMIGNVPLAKTTTEMRAALEKAGYKGEPITNLAKTEKGTLHHMPELKMDVRVMSGGPKHGPRVVTNIQNSKQAANPVDGNAFKGNLSKSEQAEKSHFSLENDEASQF